MEYITLPTGRIAYTRKGIGEPVLLIHGLGSSSLDWQAQIEYLSQYYEVYAIDLRGHGLSEKLTAPISLADLANDTAGFISAMGLEPCQIIGISMGGMVTFQLMAQRPELVKAAVIINSAPYFPADSFSVRMRIFLRFMILRIFGLKALSRSIANKLFPASQIEHRNTAAERIANNDERSYLFSLKAIVGWSAFTAVQSLNTRVLVISGDRDYTTVEHKQNYVNQLKNANLVVVEDSGHATPIDQPHKLNQLLRTFIDENKQPGSDNKDNPALNL